MIANISCNTATRRIKVITTSQKFRPENYSAWHYYSTAGAEEHRKDKPFESFETFTSSVYFYVFINSVNIFNLASALAFIADLRY